MIPNEITESLKRPACHQFNVNDLNIPMSSICHIPQRFQIRFIQCLQLQPFLDFKGHLQVSLGQLHVSQLALVAGEIVVNDGHLRMLFHRPEQDALGTGSKQYGWVAIFSPTNEFDKVFPGLQRWFF